MFDRYFEPLTIYSNRITGDLAATENIAVDALVKTIDRRGAFSALPKFKSLPYQVLHDASISHVTSDRRHQVIDANIRFQEQYDQASEVVIETEVLRAEVLQEIHAEIENLPDHCREIFKLLFVEGLPTTRSPNASGLRPKRCTPRKPM